MATYFPHNIFLKIPSQNSTLNVYAFATGGGCVPPVKPGASLESDGQDICEEVCWFELELIWQLQYWSSFGNCSVSKCRWECFRMHFFGCASICVCNKSLGHVTLHTWYLTAMWHHMLISKKKAGKDQAWLIKERVNNIYHALQIQSQHQRGLFNG